MWKKRMTTSGALQWMATTSDRTMPDDGIGDSIKGGTASIGLLVSHLSMRAVQEGSAV